MRAKEWERRNNRRKAENNRNFFKATSAEHESVLRNYQIIHFQSERNEILISQELFLRFYSEISGTSSDYKHFNRQFYGVRMHDPGSR